VQVVPPGETGRRITEDGLLANYFPAARRAPAVLLLAGSVGGLPPGMNNAAKALQSEGISTLYLSYFRGPGQNPRLELIPLEYFATALAWLKRQPEVDADRIAIVGGSKGAEAALLVAVRHPELKAVIAGMPSSVVWTGIVWGGSDTPIASSWSERGTPLPHLPHTPFDASQGATMAENYSASLAMLPKHPEAAIPVERIAGRVLLVCGESDRLWPSCPMARQIEARLREHRRPAATLLAYADAGHAVFGLPTALDDPRLTSQGGTPQGAFAALSDSWDKAIAFLKASLGD
jgi:dienelactone hydrolase